jgi:hypothetical protein
MYWLLDINQGIAKLEIRTSRLNKNSLLLYPMLRFDIMVFFSIGYFYINC